MIAIYGKSEGMKRMRPLDYENGVFVSNRINMTIWNDEVSEGVQGYVDYLNSHNKGMKFELRHTD